MSQPFRIINKITHIVMRFRKQLRIHVPMFPFTRVLGSRDKVTFFVINFTLPRFTFSSKYPQSQDCSFRRSL